MPISGTYTPITSRPRQMGEEMPTPALTLADAPSTLRELVAATELAALDDAAIERRLRHWMADCAARVLHVFEKRTPGDFTVRTAILTARRYARGDADWTELRAAQSAAGRAAGRIGDSAAASAAWAAASATACSAAMSARWAAATDAPEHLEQAWQFDRLVAWLSDPEPEELALPDAALQAAE